MEIKESLDGAIRIRCSIDITEFSYDELTALLDKSISHIEDDFIRNSLIIIKEMNKRRNNDG